MSSRTMAVIAAALPMTLAAALHAQNDRAAACTALANTALPNTSITAAETITGGSFTVPGSTNTMNNLVPFCRIAGTIKPTPESDIRFEVRLPLEHWNGRFAGVGNGGWAGTISDGPLQEELRRGYAAASSNTGHQAGPPLDAARFAHEHPEQLVDFAYRAHHETTLKAKALVNAFYGKAPERAYWFGCSSGGNEGLHEAQRFPEDYDGIVAGAPANNFTRLMAGDFDATQAVLKDSASNLSTTALGVLYRGVLATCDARDGVTDGVVEDPRQCRFDPGTLQCSANQKPETCLTAAQVEAARRVHRGPVGPSGARIYPGLSVGSEPFWPNRDPASPFPIPISDQQVARVRRSELGLEIVGHDSGIGLRRDSESGSDARANSERHQSRPAGVPHARRQTAPMARLERSADRAAEQHRLLRERALALRRQHRRRSELLPSLHGARDDALRRRHRPEHDRHASGVWRNGSRKARPPSKSSRRILIGGVVDRSRPLCPYPQVAVYKGTGDTNDAGNFACRSPSQ